MPVRDSPDTPARRSILRNINNFDVSLSVSEDRTIVRHFVVRAITSRLWLRQGYSRREKCKNKSENHNYATSNWPMSMRSEWNENYVLNCQSVINTSKWWLRVWRFCIHFDVSKMEEEDKRSEHRNEAKHPSCTNDRNGTMRMNNEHIR